MGIVKCVEMMKIVECGYCGASEVCRLWRWGIAEMVEAGKCKDWDDFESVKIVESDDTVEIVKGVEMSRLHGNDGWSVHIDSKMTLNNT